MSVWEDLRSVDIRFVAAAQKIYKTPLHLRGAFDDLQGACDLVSELLSAQLSPDILKRIGLQLYTWKERMEDHGPEPVSLLCRSIAERPSKIQRTSPSVGEVFEELVAGSPSISLAALNRALKSRKRTGQSAEELEWALKEKWSLVPAKFTQEAGLPVSCVRADGSNQCR